MMSELKKTAVVGGGAAGFFLAINLKERCPEMHVSILERSQRVLAKVEVSDGVTGGFNFQAAWTTAWTVAQAIAQRARL